MPISLKANSDGSAEILNGVVSALKINTDGSLEGTTIDGKLNRSENINLGASVAASGTAVDFVGIPTGVKRITVMLNGVSTNGTSNLLLQVGDTGGFETSGYSGTVTEAASAVVSLASTTSGWALSSDRADTDNILGSFSLVRISGNTWLLSGTGKDGSWNVIASGSKTLSDTLDRVRITTVNGTDQFDAGTINISWEF